MTAPLRSRWNGAFAGSVQVGNRGLHYGDGVFRTMLLHGGAIVTADAQIERLTADAAALGLDAPSREFLLAELAAVADLDEAILKLMLIRTDTGRGYPPRTHRADLLLLAYPPPDWPASHAIDGIAAIRSPVTMASQPLLAGIKHLNRLEQVLASRDWPADVDEALLADEHGNPVCGTRSNLFWVSNGRLYTPALDRCGVAGLTRAQVLALAAQLGIDCTIASQPWTALQSADEAFLCNSLIGIWPLRRLDDHLYPVDRPITRRLQTALVHPLAHPFRGV
ncbi:aminodeoxychorismate lyase [uncultured Nevskia sp.]|uniref:aminodeoxychorismate lyase n=1 Tax=uncultured Nevskia sp. TaxID=228950 RepID=UPI0025E8F25E|nr:aminodeoxychorismate lyase [uncultured Nevskia sp.]